MTMLQNSTQSELRRKRESTDQLASKLEKRARSSPSKVSQGVGFGDDSASDSDASDLDNGYTGDRTPSTPRSAAAWPSLKKTISCTHPGCSKLFNRQAKLRDHLRYHTGERPYLCPNDDCDRSFPRKTHLDRHIKSAHTEIRDYICTYVACGKAFSTGTRLRRHLATHEKRLQFSCRECGQEFRKHGTLQKHVDTIHKGKKPFVCNNVIGDSSICGAGFDKASGLRNHVAHMHSAPKYECTICSSKTSDLDNNLTSIAQTFATYNEFQRHNREVHPPTCELCSVAFDAVKQFNRHMDLVHGVKLQSTNEASKPSFLCIEDDCGRTFHKKGNLDVHIRSVHLQVRPFVCERTDALTLNNIYGWNGEGACMRDFKSKSHLEEHIRTTHLGMPHRHKAKRNRGTEEDHEASSSVKSRDDGGIAALLTGTSYMVNPKRRISCVITGCSHVFAREYDFDQHLRAHHGLEEDEVQIARLSHPLKTAGFETNEHQADDCQSVFHDMMINDERGDMPDRLNETLAQYGCPDPDNGFWIGASQDEEQGLGQDIDSWHVEETEMRELVGEGHGWEDDIIVDPALRG